MNITRPQEGYNRNTSFLGNFAEGLSGGIQQGIGMALQNMFEEKQYQRDIARQQKEWAPKAKALAKIAGNEKYEKILNDLGPQGSQFVLENFGFDALDNIENDLTIPSKEKSNSIPIGEMTNEQYEKYKKRQPKKSHARLDAQRNRDRKEQQRKKAVEQIYLDAGIDPEEALQRSEIESEATARANTKPSEYEKAFQGVKGKKEAEEIMRLNEEIPKLHHAQQNINKIRQLSNELGSWSPLKGAKSYLGISPKAAEMEALSTTELAPVFEVFNPRGALSTQKMKFVLDTHALKGTDLQSVREAKLRAIETRTKQALERAETRRKLIENRAPPEEIAREDERTERMVQGMEDMANAGFDQKKVIENLLKETNGDIDAALKLADERGIVFDV